MGLASKRILVTGATGFIGRACVERLKSDGYTVLCAGRNKTDDIFCDLSEPQTCLSIPEISDLKVIIHLGARVGLNGESLEQLFAPNILSTALISELAISRNIYLVFASTAIVSGIHCEQITDQSILNPDTPYSQSKALAEECIRASGVSASILRIGGVFGLDGPRHLGLNRVIGDACNGIAPKVFGDGSGKRNYISVDDLAAIISNTVQHQKTGTHIVAGCDTLSIAEMMRSVCNVFGIISGPVWLPGDSSRSQLLHSLPDFTGNTPFGESLEAIKQHALLS